MKFSIFDLGSQIAGMSHADVYQSYINRAVRAESLGFDAYFATEHHFDPDFQIVPSPHLLIAAIAGRTSKIRLGVMCTILPQHHPVQVAEEIRMMDILTNGRLEMGFGRGAQGKEQAGYGVDRAEAATLFDHSLKLITTLLRDGEVESYDTGRWKGDRVYLVPEATQRPYPPMWVTAVSDATLVKAGAQGLKVATSFLAGDEELRTMRVYRDAWSAVRPGRGHYACMHHVFVGRTEKEANELARPFIEGWLGNWLKIVGDAPSENKVDRGYEEHAEYFKRIASAKFDDAVANDMVIFGTPDQTTKQILRLQARGVDEFLGWFQFGGLDIGAANELMKLFGNEVAPRIREEREAVR